jgi:hypothetical protein
VADAEIGSNERAERAAHNQALFRAVNERINDDAWRVDPCSGDPGVALDQWICECANIACFERIALSAVEYAHVRDLGWRFAVAPAELHVFPDIEALTEQQERFWIVEKSGRARTIALDLYAPRGHG